MMSEPEEIFPLNLPQRGGLVRLGDHYTTTLTQMGHDPAALPDNLFFTFCGDLLGASGEHYRKGAPVTFPEVCSKASRNFSDDFMESLAMYAMPRLPVEVNLPILMQYRDIFHDFIKDHFESMSLTYSPWFGALFNARTTPEYADILQKHASCGAAMRATVLAVAGLDDAGALPYFLISHANLEAIEGAYAVMGLARAANMQQGFDTALKNAESAANAGRRLCQTFQRGQGWGAQDFPPVMSLIRKVLETGNPYLTIHDIKNEGIETRFVVPAAFLCVKRGLDHGSDVRAGIESVITEGLHIGGDPDTICSIALGLYGLFRPAATRAALEAVMIGDADK